MISSRGGNVSEEGARDEDSDDSGVDPCAEGYEGEDSGEDPCAEEKKDDEKEDVDVTRVVVFVLFKKEANDLGRYHPHNPLTAPRSNHVHCAAVEQCVRHVRITWHPRSHL